jgi:hypothetical protein
MSFANYMQVLHIIYTYLIANKTKVWVLRLWY